MSEKIDSVRKKTGFRMCLVFLAGALLALLVIFPLRGIMNAVSRIDYISQRLDDYPRMKAVYLQDSADLADWWQKEVYDQRALQAAFIFTNDKKRLNDREKLDFVTELTGAEKVRIVSAEEARIKSGESTPDHIISSAELADGRFIMFEFRGGAAQESAAAEDDTVFLSQLEAGLPGYICVVRDGVLSVYPEDENAEDLRSMIGSMLESGALDPAGLAEEARKNGEKTALKVRLNPRTGAIPARKYLLYSAAYAGDTDFVVNVSDTAALFRFGRKRSWALWFLCSAIMVLLGQILWMTQLYTPGKDPGEELRTAVKTSVSAMFMAVLFILGSVLVIQMLSSVNLAQQGATDQAEYLRKVLDQESERGSEIEKEFDSLYLSRAYTAARVLTDDPQMLDADSLHALDHVLNGAGLRAFDAEGNLLATDELLHSATDTSMIHLAGRSSGFLQDRDARWTADEDEDSPIRYYRSVMVNDEGRTIGWVELCVEQRQLDDLLRETSLKEVIGDLHILDTLHAVAVNKDDEGKITASTWKNWVGDSAGDHGIHTELLYDGYEGIVNFDGSKCYSVVFSYGDGHVIVGSENETALVFLGGVLILTWLLSMLTMLAVYRPLVKLILGYQKREAASDPEGRSLAARSEYPHLFEYVSSFMCAVFLLSAALFFTTKGNPAGLTYNIVRGTWSRGVNAATVTTCIMLMSVVFAVRRLMDIAEIRLGKYLSPRGMTIYRLMESGFAYLGTIGMIIYALSMFGVNTATLIGGVGATALIFTLGANSLIADVLAGIFIIFEGDFTVGDVIVIDDFRGIVTDIGMRTTKLMDDNTKDIRIINNSTIKSLTNQSRENSMVVMDIPVSRAVGLEKGEAILQEALRKLPEQYPEIIGTPYYWGISKLPEKSPYTGKLGGFKARIAIECRESDKEMLTYQVSRSLIALVSSLNSDPPPAP